MLQFQDNYPLKNITTLGIGGPAKKFVAVKTEEELVEALKYAKENNLQFLVIGGGSNLLIADQGFAGLVIKNGIAGISTWEESKPTSQVSTKPSGESFRLPSSGPSQVKANSGTLLQELVDYTTKHGLSGLEKLAGIPGTVGGAVFGNAGAYGQSISDYITKVVIMPSTSLRAPQGRGNLPSLSIDEGGRFLTTFGMTKEACNFTYRDSIFKKTHDIILEVTFSLKPADPQVLKTTVEETLAKRLVKYPAGIKCPGSFFKNIIASSLPQDTLNKIPPGKIVYGKIPAGTLLEEVGAKGQCLDGIAVAPYHANLFINQGTGTAQTFYNLAKTYQAKVKEKFGITLEPEVQLVNLPPF